MHVKVDDDPYYITTCEGLFGTPYRLTTRDRTYGRALQLKRTASNLFPPQRGMSTLGAEISIGVRCFTVTVREDL